MDFTGLYKNYWNYIVRYVKYQFPNLSSGDHEDIAQSTFIKAWQQIEKYNSERATVAGWLTNLAFWEGLTEYNCTKSRSYVTFDVYGDLRSTPDVAHEYEVRRGLEAVAKRAEQMYTDGRETLLALALARSDTGWGDAEELADVLGITSLQANRRVYYLKKVIRRELLDEV